MKAIIIAAGMGKRLRPYTEDKPKCLIDICGKTILERQMEALKANDINDFVVVKGYQQEKINYPGLQYFINDNYQNNNILNSLFYAEKAMGDEFITSYSDILYDKSVVERLLATPGDISLVVDMDWQEYYQGRTKHPIGEAENVIITDGKITKIGKHLTGNESQGEFIGMAKFSRRGAEILREEFKRVKEQYSGKPFQRAAIFEKAYLTDMFQEIIDRGYDICPALIQKNWWEIDTDEDLEKVNEIFKGRAL